MSQSQMFAPLPTTTVLKEIILGTPPSKSNSYGTRVIAPKDPTKRSFAQIYKKHELTAYENNFKLQLRVYRNKLISEEFKIEVDFFFPNRRNDLDGGFKCLLDCLQEFGAIKNDNLCMEIVAKKYIDASNPRVEFVLTPLK